MRALSETETDTRTEDAAIGLLEVGRTFRSGRQETIALRDFTASIGAGEFVSIIGPSGCGKSTLLKLVSGLMRPTQGQIRMTGRVVSGPRSDVGMVFQQPRLLPWRSVLKNVLLPAEILRLPRAGARVQALDLLELVGLSGSEDRPAYELSGGMQQRVAICRALIHGPEILLMDEPFGALDAITRDTMSYELLKIWNVHKKTVLFVTHSISEALLLSDRILVMKSNPGELREEIRVELPRPRDPEIEHTPDFQAYVRHLKGLLHHGG
jgi:NitT/TauT family transport system ATP-binding protein